MNLYSFLLIVVKVILFLFNGKPIVIGRENLPKDAAIIASTHRHWLDPVILAIAVEPTEIAFMAKDTLFKNKIFQYLLPRLNVFPVKREKPSPKSLRRGVEVMNEENKHLGIFPTGSRYSTEVKGGTAFIQRLSKKDILPVAVQPPLNGKEFFLRKKAKVAIGQPISFDDSKKYTRDELKSIDIAIAQAFDDLDKQLDPDYVYIPPKKD
ncbi:1-acyl-sn-glycerol-3-phosphate acyltransferase [Aerococcaceae bacterium DSM 111021]|nr:1-acyl-sn-glycerol-3-phosphate acyltransferase [Aerococcaceae bacterium DSM 111021]